MPALLLIGFFSGAVAATATLLAGFGLLVALLAYSTAGTLGMLAAAAAVMRIQPHVCPATRPCDDCHCGYRGD